MSARFSLVGTHLAAGVSLQRFFFGPLSLLLYVFVISGFGVYMAQVGTSSPLVIALALLLYPLVVVHEFLQHVFENEDVKPWGNKTVDLLTYAVVKNLKNAADVRLTDLLQSASKSPSGLFIIQEFGLNRTEFLSLVQSAIEKGGLPDVQDFLEGARKRVEELKRRRIDSAVILYHFLLLNDATREILHEKDLSEEDLFAIVKWESFHKAFDSKAPFWSPDGLLGSFGGIGRTWVMGYTDALDQLTEDISSTILWKGKRFVRIHQEEQKNALYILDKSELHDVLLIGRPGVGKRTLIKNIAYALHRHEKKHFKPYTRVLLLKTEELLSGVDNPDSFLLGALKRAQQSGRFVLVIQDLPLLLRSGSETLRAILVKFLREENIQIIGISSTEDYHQHVRTAPDLDQYFEKLTVDEASDEETMAVMMERYFELEAKKHVKITYKALRTILSLCHRYLGAGAFPGKAIEILDDAVTFASKEGGDFVREHHIREVISRKANMDISQVSDNEKQKLLSLTDTLKSQIVGQEDAVKALVSTLKRARLEIGRADRPLGTFLFLGSTGVGKTHTAKMLASAYFGSTDRMIRLDMNEYSTESSVEHVVGTQGAAGGYLAQRVRDNPFSLILLDEIEKAHTKVLNLFLQILDEGMLIDSNGTKTDFTNCIIIATSNAGALFIRNQYREFSEEDRPQFKQQLIDHILQEQLFSPEFLNRFDETIVFEPLTMKQAESVAQMMLLGIAEDLRERRGILLTVEPDALEVIVRKGYSAEFGAREMRRSILETIENFVADYMLNNNVRRGDTIVIRGDDLSAISN